MAENTSVPPYSERITSQIKYITRYSFVLRPNESVQMPHHFVMTEIAKAPPADTVGLNVAPETVLIAGANRLLPDASNLEFNLLVDEREYLFRRTMPWLGVPSLPFKYEMPCLWYLPRGTSLKFLADHLQVEDVVVGATHFRPTLIVGGYFVEEPPAAIRERLFRPMIMVFRHFPIFTLPGDAAIVPSCPAGLTMGADPDFKVDSESLPTDRNFLIRKLSYCAIRDTSLGAVSPTPPVPPSAAFSAYTAQQYSDYVIRFSYNGTFYITDRAERMDAMIPHKDFPINLRKMLRVTGGNSVVIESTYTRGVAPVGSFVCCNYTIVGGILVHKPI